jgi:hypothetical protein
MSMKLWLVSGLGVAALNAHAQPVQWRVEDGGNGHWYEWEPVLRTWTGARAHAESQGGYLVTIRSAEEQAFLNAHVFRPAAFADTWLGATRSFCEANYEWVTSEPFSPPTWTSLGYDCIGWAGPGTGNFVEQRIRDGAVLGWEGESNDANIGNSSVIEYSADCNNDGIVDKGQILAGHLIDANNNGVPDGGVSITLQPASLNLAAGVPVLFTVEAQVTPDCATPVVYMWQRRNPLVSNDGDPDAWIDLEGVAGFVNATTASLGIPRPTPGMATGFRCRVSTACGCESGQLFTDIVNFTLACPSDFNADGSVDGDDVIEFFERWDNGC